MSRIGNSATASDVAGSEVFKSSGLQCRVFLCPKNRTYRLVPLGGCCCWSLCARYASITTLPSTSSHTLSAPSVSSSNQQEHILLLLEHHLSHHNCPVVGASRNSSSSSSNCYSGAQPPPPKIVKRSTSSIGRMSSTSSQQAAHFTTPLDDSRWSSGGGNSCGSANTSLTSSTSFAMDSLASSHGSTVGDHGNSISPVQQHNMDEPKRSYSACALSLSDTSDGMIGFERKPYKPFRSNEEYLIAMKEDLAEWLNTLYTLDITADNFLNRLETGVILCKYVNYFLIFFLVMFSILLI